MPHVLEFYSELFLPIVSISSGENELALFVDLLARSHEDCGGWSSSRSTKLVGSVGSVAVVCREETCGHIDRVATILEDELVDPVA